MTLPDANCPLSSTTAADLSHLSVLLTGGTGYIGSHTTVQLIEAGAHVHIIDNLSNSHPGVLDRIAQITGTRPDFTQLDIRDQAGLDMLFSQHHFDAVIHFAGLKSVSESEAQPLHYYDHNVAGSCTLLKAMSKANITTLVFSSSATVYGNPGYPKYTESTPLDPINVYGRTKMIVEQMLRDLQKSNPKWRIALLRYFNPVGAHASGLIGEDPSGTPNNLMPFIAQVAVGKRAQLSIFGNDYPTPDGTGLRDYIHVDDLAAGHLAALSQLSAQPELLTVNLGTGRTYSVLEMIQGFASASGKTIPHTFAPRREGDLAEYYADPTLAMQLLGWTARYDIDRMCEDTWRWQQKNPQGYRTAE